MTMTLPPLIKVINRCCPTRQATRREVYKWSIFLLTFLSYLCYHMSRRPFPIVKNSKGFLDCPGEVGLANMSDTCTSWLTEFNGESEADVTALLGVIDSVYLFSYAIFIFASGWVAERMDLRYFLSLGMFLSGVAIFMQGAARLLEIHSLWYFIVLQFVAGIFQSTGWPGVVAVLANWFGKGNRGLIMGIWNSHTSIGNIVGSQIAGSFAEDNWGLSFMVPGIIIAALGIVFFLCMVPHPAHLGFEDEEDSEQDETKKEEVEEEKAIGFLGAIKIPGVLEFSLCLFFAKMVSYTFLYWLPKYIAAMNMVDAEDAAVLSELFDVGGIFGGIMAGIMTDRFRKPASTCGVMLVIAVPCMLVYQNLVKTWCPMELEAPGGSPLVNSCYWWNIVLTMVVGFFVNGPYALITTAVSAELGQHPSLQGSGKALATVTAIIDGTGSIGAAVGGLLPGILAKDGNWDSVIYMLMVADVLAILLVTRIILRELRQLCGRKDQRGAQLE